METSLYLLKNSIADVLSVKIDTASMFESDLGDIQDCLLLFQNFAVYFNGKISQYEHKFQDMNAEMSISKLVTDPGCDIFETMIDEDNIDQDTNCSLSPPENKREDEQYNVKDTNSQNEVSDENIEPKNETEVNISPKIEIKDPAIEGHLNRLMSRIKNTEEKKGVYWNCNACEYSVKSKMNMTSHVESNHGELKYKCKHCEYETKTSKVLGRHICRTLMI